MLLQENKSKVQDIRLVNKMDLWIRSQDKTNLIKVDRLDVSENKIEANLKFHYNGCNYVVLGEYATNRC